MSNLYEVVIETDEPWHDGLRQRVADAITAFTDNKLENMPPASEYDFDAQLASYVHDYAGYGTNAHPDADGFVFSSIDRAQAFADHMRKYVGFEAAVWQSSLPD